MKSSQSHSLIHRLDIPAALHQQLKDYMPESNKFEFQFNLLYTVYSLPNVILPFFGGYVVDCFGAPVCLGSFAFLCWVGQLTFAVGAVVKSWPIMLIGRTVYGFGGESICVAYSTLLSQWFAGREVAFAFGVALAISRLGSVLNNLVSPGVADTFSTPWALWMGVL
jgi:MFS family permease